MIIIPETMIRFRHICGRTVGMSIFINSFHCAFRFSAVRFAAVFFIYNCIIWQNVLYVFIRVRHLVLQPFVKCGENNNSMHLLCWFQKQYILKCIHCASARRLDQIVKSLNNNSSSKSKTIWKRTQNGNTASVASSALKWINFILKFFAILFIYSNEM